MSLNQANCLTLEDHPKMLQQSFVDHFSPKYTVDTNLSRLLAFPSYRCPLMLHIRVMLARKLNKNNLFHIQNPRTFSKQVFMGLLLLTAQLTSSIYVYTLFEHSVKDRQLPISIQPYKIQSYMMLFCYTTVPSKAPQVGH